MKYVSTRGSKKILSSTEAVLQGLAEDGGLYMPDGIDYSKFDWKSLIGLRSTEMAERILGFFFDDFGNMHELTEKAYEGKFDAPDMTPLVKVGNRYILELFHGPTSAFKDVALSVLPRLMSQAMIEENEKRDICILTATSGDTGKAALEGFHDVEGIKIIVFYPDGGVSPIQRLQMASQIGNNVSVLAVKGNFDDAQTGVKKIFEKASKEGLPEDINAVLSSANSINIGRLVPQITYYFKAYSTLVEEKAITLGEKINFTVPTGNFGDILAGFFAKLLGLPVEKLICASNKNNILTDFLTTGVYDKNRPFYKTVSPSMDILVSSNLERLLYLMSGGDAAYVKGLMSNLSEKGVYSVSPEFLKKLKETFECGYTGEEETLKTIQNVWEKEHYLMDTHTAVAYRAADRFTGEGALVNVVLSTASPYKFPKAVALAVSAEDSGDEFELIENIHKKTEVKVPSRISALKDAKIRFTHVIEKDDMWDIVMETVRNF